VHLVGLACGGSVCHADRRSPVLTRTLGDGRRSHPPASGSKDVARSVSRCTAGALCPGRLLSKSLLSGVHITWAEVIVRSAATLVTRELMYAGSPEDRYPGRSRVPRSPEYSITGSSYRPVDPLFNMFFFDVSPGRYRRFMKYSHVQKQLPTPSEVPPLAYLTWTCESIVGYVSGTFSLKECQSLRCPMRHVMPDVPVLRSRLCREDRCRFFRRLSLSPEHSSLPLACCSCCLPGTPFILTITGSTSTKLLPDVMVIADEVDSQLAQAMASYTAV
jgi:hypothetical protein